MSDDFAPLYRRITRSDVWRGQHATTKVVAIWVVLNIRHQANEQTPAGSVDCTHDDIARDCELHRNVVGRALRELELVGFVTQERARGFTRITVPNAARWLRRSKRGDDASERSQYVPSTSQQTMALALNQCELRTDSVHASLQEEKKDLLSSKEGVSLQQTSAATRRSKPAPIAGWQDTIDLFQRAFVEAYGRKPTWKERDFANLKRMLKAHGPEEVGRRIVVLFTSPPRWLAPPYDFGTLVQHFDKLVQPASVGATTAGQRRGGLSIAEVMNEAVALAGEQP